MGKSMAQVTKILQNSPVNPESFESRVDVWANYFHAKSVLKSKHHLTAFFIDSAIHLVKDNGCTQKDARLLVDYVFSRPTGDTYQEIGGVMVTLACLCSASGINMHDDGEAELSSICTNPIMRPMAVIDITEQDTFQSRVVPWLKHCFGEEIAADRVERNPRFLEESLELVQAEGVTAEQAHYWVAEAYKKEALSPQPALSVGNVMVNLAVLCRSLGLCMHENADIELARIWTKVEKIRHKQKTKPKHSPLPMAQ